MILNDGKKCAMSISKGNQTKFMDDNIWYKVDFLGYEGAAEYFASELCKFSNISDFVSYDMTSIILDNGKKDRLGCKSDNFLKEGENVISADRLFKQKYNKSAEEYLQNMPLKEKILTFVSVIEEITGIQNYGPILTQMLEFDSFILNEDRHFNNIAFVYNSKDDCYKPTPLFDNGAAFLSDTKEDYPLEKNIYGLISDVHSKPFSDDFDKQVETAEELYGQQLFLQKGIDMDQVLAKIEKVYGTKIRDRIDTIFSNQYFRSKFIESNNIQK